MLSQERLEAMLDEALDAYDKAIDNENWAAAEYWGRRCDLLKEILEIE